MHLNLLSLFFERNEFLELPFMQLFYNPEISTGTQQFTFDNTDSRHIVRVLRKTIGDTIFITNGSG